jgi:hypothetical protein
MSCLKIYYNYKSNNILSATESSAKNRLDYYTLCLANIYFYYIHLLDFNKDEKLQILSMTKLSLSCYKSCILNKKEYNSPMNIVCFRPRPSANLNDTFIEWGIKVLLKEVLEFPIIFHDVYFEPLDKLKIPDHDLFVVCGTPWLWDQCTLSQKYQDLTEVLSNSHAPKIALGIGSCFPFSFECNTTELVNRSMPNISNILSYFASISVRDNFAKTVCDLLEIQADLLCCPAVFARNYIKFKIPKYDYKRDIIFFYVPQLGLSAEVLNKDFVEHYIKLQIDYTRRYNAQLICINKDEAKWAIDYGVEAEKIKNPEELAQTLLSAKTLLSGRVHGCIFIAGLSIPSALLPVDTRFLTYQNIGGKIIMSEDVSEITKDELQRCKFTYILQKWKWKMFLRKSLRRAKLL